MKTTLPVSMEGRPGPTFDQLLTVCNGDLAKGQAKAGSKGVTWQTQHGGGGMGVGA